MIALLISVGKVYWYFTVYWYIIEIDNIIIFDNDNIIHLGKVRWFLC